MQDFHIVLTDVDANIYVPEWRVTSTDLGIGGPRFSVTKRRLFGGLRDGVDVIEVDNGSTQFVVIPTRGMGIWKGWHQGWELGWQSPVRGPVHPGFVNELLLGQIGWLGGFDEWIVRCGLSSNGAPGTDEMADNQGVVRKTPVVLHGHIANRPAHQVEVRISKTPPHRIAVLGVVDETMLFFPQLRLSTCISTTPGQAGFSIHDAITNLKSQPAEAQLLYHCNFGPPLLGAGSRLMAPVRELAPRGTGDAEAIDVVNVFPGPTPGVVEQGYFFRLLGDAAGQTAVALCNAAGDKACLLSYDLAALPCFTLWKNPAALSDGYVTGLEPATNYPNLKTFERQQGRVVKLESGQSHAIKLDVEIADGREKVDAMARRIAGLQQAATPIIHRQPHPSFSPS